ncbi:MAG: DUF192 domain-containing protein [Candidatus Doudnabacteria bacterium]
MKIKIFLIFVPLIFLAAGCTQKAPETKISFGTGSVTINGHKLNVQIAETPQAQEKGLGGRNSLAENDAMLFVFPEVGRMGFWMKDTLIPLDFIWIREGKIVEITPNVPTEPNVPDASLRTYAPEESIDSTIEVNAGWTAKNNIKVGDEVTVIR